MDIFDFETRYPSSPEVHDILFTKPTSIGLAASEEPRVKNIVRLFRTLSVLNFNYDGDNEYKNYIMKLTFLFADCRRCASCI